jgi:hypothetical protein
MSETAPNDKKWYNVNLGDKIKKKVKDVQDFKVGLEDNKERLKKITDEYSRKDINFDFIDRFTRKLYSNSNHLIKLEVIQYIIFIILIYYYNPLNINTNYPVFTKLLVLSVSFIYVLLFIFVKIKVDTNDDVDLIDPTESDILIKFISLIAFFVLFMLVIKGVIWVLVNTSIINIFRHMFGLFIFIGVAAIAYLFLKKTIKKSKNAPGRKLMTLFIKFIMYLPCLMVDIAEYIKYQFNLTTKPIWILLGMEGVFIALYFLVPLLFDKITNADGLKLLNQPINLTEEHTLGNFIKLRNKKEQGKEEDKIKLDDLYNSKINQEAKERIEASTDSLNNIHVKGYTDPKIPKNKFLAWIYNKLKHPMWIKVTREVRPQYSDYDSKRHKYAYALSGWFNINPQPPNTRTAYTTYTNILKYGEKVKLEYNGQLGSLRVMAAVASAGKEDILNKPNDSVEIYETKKVLYQKWNNIVINYDEGNLDIFLNGDLVVSRPGVAPYMSFDNVVSGAPTGILGGICNVTYYEKPLSKSTIELAYKALRGKANPYVWRLKDAVSINIEVKKNKTFINQIKNVFGA